MPLEIETKFKVLRLDPFRRRLEALGADFAGTVREKNWILDGDKDWLRRRGVLFRLRDVGNGGVLTVKGPPKDERSGFKTREEINCRVDSVPAFLLQMEMLEYWPIWIYEKIRESWKWRDCSVELDEFPEIGFFIEIEGDPGRIPAAALDLGLDPESRINETYFNIWVKYLDESRQPFRDMVFAGGEGKNLPGKAEAE
ncbi:MAG: class IV adenylate cyclase [Planctomycetota bacterium]|nr:class IV adenylate cyclase [Planctomycetota bacterium]